MLNALLLLIAASPLQDRDVPQVTRVVPVKHVSAQYLYELITMTGRFADETAGRGFVPDGVKLVADARTNSIVAAGPDDSVREIELLIQQMDVPPRPLTIEVKGAIPSLSRSIATKSEVVNNSALTVDDGSSDTSLTIRPRVNGDGSVTVSVKGTVYGSTCSFVHRLKSSETYYVRIVPPGLSPGTPQVVSYFVRELAINEDAFLSGEPLSTLLPEFKDDTSRALNGELRLIVRVKVP